MTTELQRAMAQYEEHRFQYRKAVLSALGGAANGDAIREAIQRFQRAHKELQRLQTANDAAVVRESSSEDIRKPLCRISLRSIMTAVRKLATA